MALNLNYYYGSESEQYSFYRIPKLLFTEPAYGTLAAESKVLYGLMLDRMSLSIRNNWVDSLGRVYIYFTLEDALEMLHLGRNKVIRLFKELEDIGLIDRKKQGQGKPTLIYVKNFILPQTEPQMQEPVYATEEKPAAAGKATRPGLSKQAPLKSQSGKSALPESGSLDVSNREVQRFQIQTSGGFKTGLQEVSNSNPNNTEYNNTYLNDTDLSIPPLTPPSPEPAPQTRRRRKRDEDKMEQMEIYREIIRENIEYDILLDAYKTEASLIDGYVNLMVDVCISGGGTVRINRQDMSTEVVKSRFLKLNREHIEYVLDCMKKNTTKIGNIRSYMLSALYNAPVTVNQYFSSWVNHDAAQGYAAG